MSLESDVLNQVFVNGLSKYHQSVPSEQAQSPDFSFGVPVDINAFHHSTYRSDHPYLSQDMWFTLQFLG